MYHMIEELLKEKSLDERLEEVLLCEPKCLKWICMFSYLPLTR